MNQHPPFVVELTKEFRFEAAHSLPHVPAGHKCARLHGHSFRVEITVRGTVDPRTGWLMDFGELKELFRPLEEQLDHRFLNEVAGLENSTSENIARGIWAMLRPRVPVLWACTVHVTCTSMCVYRGVGA